MPAADLEWALSQFERGGKRTKKYGLYYAYYDGDHRLTFATETFRSTFGMLFREFAENMCPAVVDSLADRLVITGFQSGDAETVAEEVMDTNTGMAHKKVTVNDPKGAAAWDLWKKTGMNLKAGETHEEAIRCGDSYVIVWPDANMQVAIWPQCAAEVRCQYDPNTEGLIIRAVKVWFDDIAKKWHMNVYLPYVIEKYTAKKNPESMPFKEGEWQLSDAVPNPYGVVPVFHFSNKGLYKWGVSELKDVIPIQDGLNKSVMDMLVAMEFAAYKQRYIIGSDPEIDEETGEPTDQTMRNYGVNRMLAIPDPDSKVGQFDATDLSQFLRVQDKFWASVAKVSGTPLHYFYITSGDFPSGEAIKSAEARFIKKISDRQESFGTTWAYAMKFALHIMGEITLPRGANGYLRFEEEELNILWKDASPRTDSELADTAVKKKAVGVSRSQILKELGYDDETIMRMLEESDSYDQWKSQLKGGPEDTGEKEQSTAQPTGENTRGVTQ